MDGSGHRSSRVPRGTAKLEVNITIGLPVIRISVDHGTAFDIAGWGIADDGSLVEALRQVADLAPRRRQAVMA